MVAALNRFMERLSSSNETLRAFMAEAAHQMRTPLAALRAQAQLALDDDDPEDMRRSLQAIERNATHMSRLLNQLLSDASVIHRSHLQRFAAVDLAETVHQALHEALPQAGPAPRVQLAMTAEPALVHGDALLLREAIKNLVDNALKYGGDGDLQIALTVEGEQAVLTIADHGAGIAPADAERVFERFARGEGAPSGGAGWAWPSSSAWSTAMAAALTSATARRAGWSPPSACPGAVHDPLVRDGRCPAAGPAGVGRARRCAPFSRTGAATAQLRIHGTTDIEVFAVVIADYQRLHPGTEVVYEDIITQDLYARYLHDRGGPASPDLLISSGMDLQTKLVNDGHALPHRSAQTAALPAWAQWRNEAFGISYEPVVMVYNTRALPAAKVPHTRRQLLDRLRAEGAQLRGKVGTYDIERSSVGYLLATRTRSAAALPVRCWARSATTTWCARSVLACCWTRWPVASCRWSTTCSAPTRRHVSMPARHWPSSSPRTTRWWCCAPQSSRAPAHTRKKRGASSITCCRRVASRCCRAKRG